MNKPNHPEHNDGHVNRALARIEAALATLDRKVTPMAGELDTLKTAVARIDTVSDSIVTLCNGLSQQIKDLVAAGADPAALTALANDLNAKADAVAAAVVANTTVPPTA